MTNDQQFLTYQVTRPVYSEKSFTEHYQTPDKTKCNEKTCCKQVKTTVKRIYNGVCCHGRKLDWFRQRCPIVDWLPKYQPRRDGVPDLIGGLTVSVMHIPQGRDGLKRVL